MISKPKSLARGFFAGRPVLTQKDVAPARQYIAEYWKTLERFHPKDDESLLALPKPYLVPAYEKGHDFDFNEMYYWDSYFMIQGLLDDEHQDLVIGMLENLVAMFKRFGVIPNASRIYLTGRSQPPLLTSFIWDVYEAYDLPKAWLKEMLAVAESEYRQVWMGLAKPHARQVHKGLSRYYDINLLHDLAEAESGWDMTPRFGRKALNYLPIDLNSLLYKYEMDFAKYYRLVGDKRTAAEWETAARHRKETIDELMWNQNRGLFYDYNYEKGRRSNVSSLAGFYPLWAGMTDENQTKALVKSLRRFEQKGGLSTTDVQPLNQLVPAMMMPTQWAHPNGWAPLQFMVIKGLLKHDKRQDAERIAFKWLKTNLDWFNQNGVFLEKYNVVSPHKPPAKGVYPSQTGFGWTNAVFEWLCQEFIDD